MKIRSTVESEAAEEDVVMQRGGNMEKKMLRCVYTVERGREGDKVESCNGGEMVKERERGRIEKR